jgi:PAS domain S-box-containing protein
MTRVTLTSLRFHLLLVTILAVLPMFGLALFMTAEQRRLAAVDVQEYSLHLVRVIAYRHEQLIDGTRQLLASLAHAPEVSGSDPAVCNALFATLLQGYPVYLNLGVIQPDGTLVCSAMPFSTPVNVSDRAYFRRALETRDFAIGDFQIGRLTGKPSVGFGYPVRSATGAVQAVLFAALDLAWLNQLATAVRLPTGVTLTVVDHQGTVLARHPDPQRWIGQAAHDTPLVKRILAHGNEGTTTATGLDGIPRLYAFTRLRGASHGVDAYVSLGVPTTIAFAQANQLLTYQLAGLGLMTALAFGVTWAVGDRIILRRVHALVRATQRLAAGDLSARTGVPYGRGELGQLARAFDDMATNLSKRQAAATRAEEALARHAERLRILHEIDRALIAEEAPEAIAGAVIRPLRELLGVPRAIVNMFDLTAHEVEWLAAAGRSRVHVGPGVRFSMRLMGDVDALRRGEAQVIDTHALPPGPAVEALLASGVEVYMVVPMIAGGELIGALSFGGPPGPFPVEQVSIAQEVATQLAIVMAQARLLDRVKHQAERMRLFSTVVESSVDAILTETVEGLMTGWNPAAERLYGFTVEEVMGQSSALLVPADRRDELQTIMEQLRRGERIAPFETIRVHKDGTQLDVSLTMSPVTTPEGVVLGVSTIARDITAQKQLQEQLRHAQKMETIGQLTVGLAHDFNNMLGVIVGNLDLLEDAVGENAVALKRIQTAQRAAMRGADLTRRLLAFARRQQLNPEPTGVNNLITELLEMLPRTLGPEIQIARQLDADLPPAQIDPAGLENALLNLAINARDAMPQGGSLTFATKHVELDTAYPPVKTGEIVAGPYIWLAVSDTGQGMSREILDKVFEPFFTTKPRDKGTGMGLAMVYGFVKQSHGNIRIYSEPGHGTTVHLYLPVAERAASPAHYPAMPRVVAHEQGTVLVVDDEVELLEVAVTYLEEMGFTTLQATDGPSALEVIACAPVIDLVLTDIVMPGGLHGVALAQQIRQQHPDIAVIYASGFPASALTARSQLHIDGPLLNKPYRKEQLAEVVYRVLASRRGPVPSGGGTP